MSRILVVVLALAASTLLGGWAFDRQSAYCAFDRDYTNCGYPTLQACLAAVSGVGGNCRANPMYTGERPSHRQPWWFR